MTSYSRAAAEQRSAVSTLRLEALSPTLVGPAPIMDQNIGDEPLSTIAREIARGLDADGLLVAWHNGAGPVALFSDGAADPQIASEMERCASSAVRGGGVSDRWSTAEDGIGEMLTTSIPADPGVITVTALFRQLGASTRDRVREAAARVLPIAKPFFRLWSQRFQASTRLRGLTAAINKSDVGTVIVDRHGQLLFANTVAESLMGEVDGIRRVGQLFCGTKLADTLRLQAAIEHVISDEPTARAAQSAGSPVLALSRKTRRPIMAAVVAGDESRAEHEEGTAIIYLFDPEEDLRPLLEPVCKLYGLSPVEAKLTCLLADGISLAEAAERMRVREQSARSYLKQIFLKTDTNRQAELVWLMLKSSVRTAPGCRTSFI